MNFIRIAIGIFLFAGSAWIAPFLEDVLGVPNEIVFFSFGGILCFFGGMIFYSGLIERRVERV